MPAAKRRVRVVILTLLVLFAGVFPVRAQRGAPVKTKWIRSDGIQTGDDIYFLSYYSLYRPGKVIIPMFIVTNPKYFYRDLSLYRLSREEHRSSSGRHDSLTRIWSFGPERSGKKVVLSSCRYATEGERLYFSWTGNWDSETKSSRHPVLEYHLRTGRGRVLEESEPPVELDYHHPDKIAASVVWGRAGLQPLAGWDLPSPLEFSSKSPAFLKKAIVKGPADREFRAAALAELDSRGEAKILRQTLAELEAAEDRQNRTAYLKWDVLIRMSNTLRGDTATAKDSPTDIFSAAFDNNTEALKSFLDAGADPDSTDDMGRTLIMYAVFGNAPDTMRLLFERGADPEKQTHCGNFPWLYAALSPLRRSFLELWGK